MSVLPRLGQNDQDGAIVARETVFNLNHGRVLAVFAHPDDAELACFGTLAMLRSLAAEITILILTNGERSSSNTLDRRKGEAVAAARLIDGDVWFPISRMATYYIAEMPSP